MKSIKSSTGRGIQEIEPFCSNKTSALSNAKKSLGIILVLCFIFSCMNAGKPKAPSETKKIRVHSYCSYNSSTLNSEILLNPASPNYDTIFKEIYKKALGVSSTDIQFGETEDSGAYSDIDTVTKTRLIYYHKGFLDYVIKTSHSKFSIRSILAHEMGHLLLWHSLRQTDDRHIFELEADLYSGILLRRMKSTLDESLFAMDIIGNKKATDTHPEKFRRMLEIGKGWINEDVDEFNGDRTNDENLLASILDKYRPERDSTKAIAILEEISSAKIYNGEVEKKSVNKNSTRPKPLPVKKEVSYSIYSTDIFISKDNRVRNSSKKIIGSFAHTSEKPYVSTITLDKRKYFIKMNGEVWTVFPGNISMKVGNQNK